MLPIARKSVPIACKSCYQLSYDKRKVTRERDQIQKEKEEEVEKRLLAEKELVEIKEKISRFAGCLVKHPVFNEVKDEYQWKEVCTSDVSVQNVPSEDDDSSCEEVEEEETDTSTEESSDQYLPEAQEITGEVPLSSTLSSSFPTMSPTSMPQKEVTLEGVKIKKVLVKMKRIEIPRPSLREFEGYGSVKKGRKIANNANDLEQIVKEGICRCYCDRFFENSDLYKIHKKKKHFFKCEDCIGKFVYGFDLTKHKFEKHFSKYPNIEKQIFRCKTCQILVENKSVHSHMRSKHNLPCPKCRLSFSTKPHRLQHYIKEHMDLDIVW